MVLAVITEGFLFDRLKIVEWFVIIFSMLLFAAAMFTYDYLGIILFTLLGIISAGVLFFMQKKRMKVDKLNLQEQIV